MMKQVLVLDANQRSALAVTRSLGKQGVQVLTADESISALSGCSKYSRQYAQYPSPKIHSLQFIDFLTNFIRQNCVDIVLPMTELTTSLLLEHRASLGQIILPLASLEVVNKLADKCQLMRIAESLRIPTPKTWYIDPARQQPDAAFLNSLPYPLVLKPGKSWLPTNRVWARHAVRFATSPNEASDIISAEVAFQHHPYMLQETVSGIGQGIFALYDKGRPLAFFAHRRLREKPPSGGVSVLSESTDLDPVMLAHAKALLDTVGWHGVAMVEFKVDQANKKPYLMEVNTRFWGSLQLAIDAGIDFPWYLYQIACGDSPIVSEEYRLGIRSRWLLGDVDSLYLTLKDRRLSLKAKLSVLAKFLTPLPWRTRHEVNRWEDPAPFLCEIRQYITALAGQ